MMKIASVSKPILFLGAENDELVPTVHMQQLFNEARKNKDYGKHHEFVLFKIAGHNNIPIEEPAKYVTAWRDFLKKQC